MNFDNNFAMQVIGGFFVFFACLELVRGQYANGKFWAMREFGINVLSFINFLGVRVALLVIVAWALVTLFPGGRGFMSDLPFWPVFLVYVLAEEYAHYWVHRWAHEWQWLWRFHKPHHTPEILNLTVAYRENWMWFIFAPNAWMGGILVWAGQMEAAMLGAAIKGSCEWMVHSALRWDLILQRNSLTRPFMAVLEKIVTLPDTHHVHHGIGRYGNAMANYGSFLFLYDILHKTAVIPHHPQEAFGLPQGARVEPWYEQLWWPFCRARRQVTKDDSTDADAGSIAAYKNADANAEVTITTFDGKRIAVSI